MEYHSPFGVLRLAGTEEGLLSLDLPLDRFTNVWPGAEPGSMPCLNEAKEWLDAYFDGERPGIETLSLCPKGNEFRQRVWECLRRIPYGETVTYGELAKKAFPDRKMSAQAVGGAVGRNPIAIILPCHRVMGAKGALTGYSGGLDAKIWLLRHEGVDISTYHRPKLNAVSEKK